MLSKKKPPPITTYKNFFKALRLSQDKYGLEFDFVQTGAEAWDDEGFACADVLWHRSPSGSYWNPIQVVHHVFFSPEKKLWVPSENAAREIGLPPKKYQELMLVYREARGHIVSLRQRMCDAVGLEVVPINERDSYRVMEDMHKRRR